MLNIRDPNIRTIQGMTNYSATRQHHTNGASMVFIHQDRSHGSDDTEDSQDTYEMSCNV